jgi:mannose-6-phosphate isomerase-like protein (cupin superfamily)
MNRTLSLGLLAALAAASAWPALAQTALPAPKSAPVVNILGSVDMGKEFPGMAGNLMVLRTITIAPGGGMALHSHKGKPEVVRVVSGVLSEQRNGGPIVQDQPGSTVVNDGSLSHVIVNMGTVPVELIAASIIPDPAAAPKP